MKADPISEITLARLSADGCAYSEDDKNAVYGALDGEVVEVKPLARKRKKRYYRAETILKASSDRVIPACDVAAVCGGCSFQHVAMKRQLTLKEQLLRDNLAPLEPEEWLAPLSGPELGYRSKARLGVKFVEKKQRVLIGFREKMKPYITDSDDCPILLSTIRALLEPLRVLVSGLSVVRAIPQIEVAAGDSSLAIIFRHLEALTEEDLEALRRFSEQHSVLVYLQPSSLESTHLLGPVTGELSYRLPESDLVFEYGPHDFTQVNLELNRDMVSSALKLLDIEPDDHVFDAFCGIGNFSLPMARLAAEVIGAEAAASSIDRARHNAERNSVKNVQFHVSDLFDESVEIPSFSRVNKVLLDPPRSGAEQLVKRLASGHIERVVYVSCNPETLARDAKTLSDSGFILKAAGVINMFPHTTHIESIALFQKAD